MYFGEKAENDSARRVNIIRKWSDLNESLMNLNITFGKDLIEEWSQRNDANRKSSRDCKSSKDW